MLDYANPCFQTLHTLAGDRDLLDRQDGLSAAEASGRDKSTGFGDGFEAPCNIAAAIASP